MAGAQASVGCRLQRDEDLELDQKVSLVSPGTNGTGEMTQKVLKTDCKKTWNTREHQRNVQNRLELYKTGLKCPIGARNSTGTSHGISLATET